MSLGFDPIISNVFFTLSLIPHLARPQKNLETEIKLDDLPYVSVIVALYKEKKEDIDLTVSSLLGQTYNKNKYEVIFVVEPDDIKTKLYTNSSIMQLSEAGILARIVQSDGTMKIKAHALNIAILQSRGEYCAFYDASDTIDVKQMEKAVALMVTGNHDIVQSTILRKGNSLLSQFLFFDTVVWFRKILPFTLRFAKGFPLSGEGLFIRRSVLDEAGYFPEALTEDAELGLILAEKNKSFALLESVTIEKTPKNVKAHVVQKTRWFKGYLNCLMKLWNSNLSLSRKFFFALLFISPLSSIFAFLGWSLLIGFGLCRLFSSPFLHSTPFMDHSIYNNFIQYWSLVLAYVGIPLCILSYAHALFVAQIRKNVCLLLLSPCYWIFIGFCAVCSIFRSTKYWGKTER